jgi:hypothetical protein
MARARAKGDDTGAGTEATPLPEGAVLSASEIKGRMTPREVSELCGVPLEKIRIVFDGGDLLVYTEHGVASPSPKRS